MKSSLPANEQEDYRREVTQARHAVPDAAFATAWTEGKAMTLEQIMAFALPAE